MRYGIISNEMSRELGFNLPMTLVWTGRDYYSGIVHEMILNELKKAFDPGTGDMFTLSEKEVVLKMKEKRDELAEMLRNLGQEEENKKLIQKYKGYYINTSTQTRIAGNIFSLIPSILDIFVSVGFDGVSESWRSALGNLEIEEGEFYKIERDVIYGDERVVRIYRNVKVLEERNDEIDPLGMFNKRDRKDV